MSETQLRSDVIAVLAKYDVRWRDDQVMAEPNAIRFSINDQPVSITYDLACPSITDLLQQKLHEFGAAEKPPPIAAAVIGTKGEPIRTEPIRTTTNGKYTVFRSSRVIAIEIEADLVIEKGNVLVIPLNRPNTMIPIPREQFAVLFSALTSEPAPAAIDEPPPTINERPAAPKPSFARQPTDLNDDSEVVEFLRSRNAPARSSTIAMALGSSEKAIEDALRRLFDKNQVTVESGYWTAKARGVGRPLGPARPKAPDGSGEGRSRLGVPPQLGRIMAAMMYITKTTGKRDLTGPLVTPLLIERDKKQYGARLPGAIDKGLVERGLPLPNERGYHYKITPKGEKAIQELGAWVYTQDGLEPPSWIQHLVSMNGAGDA